MENFQAIHGEILKLIMDRDSLKTADPKDHFEVTVRVPVTISNTNFNWLKSFHWTISLIENYQTKKNTFEHSVAIWRL